MIPSNESLANSMSTAFAVGPMSGHRPSRCTVRSRALLSISTAVMEDGFPALRPSPKGSDIMPYQEQTTPLIGNPLHSSGSKPSAPDAARNRMSEILFVIVRRDRTIGRLSGLAVSCCRVDRQSGWNFGIAVLRR